MRYRIRGPGRRRGGGLDRKSTRLNSSHVKSSYAVFCLKKTKDGTAKSGGTKSRDDIRIGCRIPRKISNDLVAAHSRVLVIASSFFFFNDTATTEIYTLSLHDALPI